MSAGSTPGFGRIKPAAHNKNVAETCRARKTSSTRSGPGVGPLSVSVTFRGHHQTGQKYTTGSATSSPVCFCGNSAFLRTPPPFTPTIVFRSNCNLDASGESGAAELFLEWGESLVS